MNPEKKLHVGLISLARRGGMVHYHIDLAKALAKNDNLVLSVIKAQVIPDDYYPSGVDCYSLNTGVGALGTFLNLFNPIVFKKFVQIIKNSSIDVLHVSAIHEWNLLIGLIIKIFIKKPLIYTVHDVKHHKDTPLYFKISDLLFRKIVDAFIIHSEEWKVKLMSRRIPSDQICVVPLGVFLHILQWKKPDIEEENLILFFGRIKPYKGLDVLLKAAPNIFSKIPDWKLFVAGSGDFQSYQNLVNDDRIEILNYYVPDEQVVGLFQRAKIVILPYRSATQSAIIPIAFSLSKAVIATQVGDFGEALQNGNLGLLIQPEDGNTLVSSVVRLAKDDQLRQSLGRKAQESVANNSSWDSIAKKHADFYKEMLNKLGSREST